MIDMFMLKCIDDDDEVEGDLTPVTPAHRACTSIPSLFSHWVPAHSKYPLVRPQMRNINRSLPIPHNSTKLILVTPIHLSIRVYCVINQTIPAPVQSIKQLLEHTIMYSYSSKNVKYCFKHPTLTIVLGTPSYENPVQIQK